jgi:hypothetical protein
MDKQLLRQNIREWVKLEEESESLKTRIRQINQSKKIISAKLLTVMKEQDIDEFDLNQEGKLTRQVKKTKQSLSKKQLFTSLAQYYKSESEAKKTADYILNMRPEKISEKIVLL